ncbi:MAG TPA: calcineurin-like phosphoesterase family protein [Sphingobacterium sp.]|nr:calcineurin-like phosphoesterase family protein [Sphingobacterium sp.]
MKKKNVNLGFRVVYSLFLAFLIIGCSKDNGGTPDNGKGKDQEPNLPRIQLVGGNNVYGYVLDESDNPITNVVVTDGFSVVKTDDKGVYQLKKNDQAKFVYYSTPAEYEIAVEATNRKIPLFYRVLSTATSPQQHNFKLKKKASIDKNFVLFGLGDPQVTDNAQVGRFTFETLEDIKAELTGISQPVYGIALGDIVNDRDNLLNTMKTTMGSTSMPIFSTIGNHDKFAASPNPKTNDLFENVFGPTHYSFNIGDVHFVCLDNVVFSTNTTYALGISQAQIDWLTKDLSHVSKDKMLIVYYHMPVRGTNFSTRTQFLNLIKDFKEVHLLCGHTHYMENYIHNVSGKQIYEHVHGATCGAWWRSNINGDGTPNGYMIYQIEGTTIKDWVYKPTKLPRDFQFRLHWGNMDFGGSYGLFSYGQPSNTLIANIWNADPAWKAEVFMDGQKLGDMILRTTAPLNQDAWSKGYHIGVLNRAASSYSPATKHLYTYQVANPNSTLKVVVTDRFGKTYEQTHVNIVTDLSSAWNY